MREFLDTKVGKALTTVVVILLIGFAGWMIYTNIGAGSRPAELSNSIMFVDISDGQPFKVNLTAGSTLPLTAPSGKTTGYPAEECWWTKDGKARTTPYYVVLNSLLGKPGPTFCPDCGRLVVEHNPSPVGENPKAPPSEQEYKIRR